VFNARLLLAVLILTGAGLAACGGNFGAGTSAPGGLLPSGPLSGIAASPSPTPNSASDIVTYGDSTAFQPLPQVAGYGGAIAFEVPSPRPSGFESVPIGATLTIAPPTDAPDLNLATPGKQGKKRERPARPLAFIALLATRDVSLSTFPKLAIDVPRDVVTTYREEEINVALYNSGEKDKIFRLAVVAHDSASPPPLPTPGKTAPPPPTPIPVTVGSPGASPAGSPAGALTPPPVPVPGTSTVLGASPVPSVSPTLPPQRILFAAAATPLKLTANKAVVFAVYAIPIATPSPSPSGSAAAASPSASGSPASAPSSAAGASASATASAAAASTAGPSAAASASGSAAPVPAGT
jgi:hypothetical protein